MLMMFKQWLNCSYTHTSEDPSVFIDHRGNYHMLINALPGGCQPKVRHYESHFALLSRTFTANDVNSLIVTVGTALVSIFSLTILLVCQWMFFHSFKQEAMLGPVTV